MEPNGNMNVSKMAIDSKRNITGNSGVSFREEVRMHEYNSVVDAILEAKGGHTRY